MRLEITGLKKVYGRTVALDGINLQIEPGEFVGLIGPNGAGKSTLLKILAGQLAPTEGSVRVEGLEVASQPDAAREKMGLVPEEPVLYDYLTAREFLEFVHGVRGKGDIEAALSVANLGADADRLIREYSQGMRRRTALAAAMLSEPPLLVLDESLNGLDPVSALWVEDALKARCNQGAAVLLSTHLLDSVERVASRIVMLRGGQIVADVPTTKLKVQGVRGLFREQL